jgi:hypothetical protein
MKITKQQLRQIILEEMENMDEGLWDQIKGTFAGVGSALTSPLGSVGQGYRRGKAASVLRSAAVDINKVRQDFVGNIEGLFKSVFSDVAKVDSSMRPVVEKWNEAIAMMDEVSDILQELSVEVKAKASTGPRDDLNVRVAESEKKDELDDLIIKNPSYLEEDEDFLGDVKSTGEWTDYTITQLQKKKDALMKKKKRTAAEVKTVRQLNFAINAKQGDYKEKK